MAIYIQESGIVNVRSGENVRVIMPSNVYGCILGDDVFVGPFCEIQNDVYVGARTRIQSHSFICSLVEVGEDCFLVKVCQQILRQSGALPRLAIMSLSDQMPQSYLCAFAIMS